MSELSAPPPVGDELATVVIVNYNGAHLLRPCLDGLAAQDLPAGSFRTVVVDNASADPSRDLIEEEYPWVELAVSHTNRGFAGGNNVALQHVSTPYAVLLNNDAVPEPSWLRELLAPLEANSDGTLVATASKILFMPKFIKVELATAPFVPGGLDPRELGVKIVEVLVNGVAVTEKVLFEKAAYGPDASGVRLFRWSRPTGTFYVPLPPSTLTDPATAATSTLEITVASAEGKPVTFSIPTDEGREEISATEFAPESLKTPASVVLEFTPADLAVDMVNNVGGLVFVNGAGADRGFEEEDNGQYDIGQEVFTACGNGMAMRTERGADVKWFDDSYFMYYEDVDLSWRLRAAGGRIEYVPQAVLRHLHSASSKPWSPGWLFHVERNRLLTLTKNANSRRAARQVALFVATTAKMTLRAISDGVRSRRRPPLGQVKVRIKVLVSYTSLLPKLIKSRRQLGRTAVVPRKELEQWLVTER